MATNSGTLYTPVVRKPGRIVFLNDDDDNGNGTPDRDEQGPITGENDLTLTLLAVWDGDGPNKSFDL